MSYVVFPLNQGEQEKWWWAWITLEAKLLILDRDIAQISTDLGEKEWSVWNEAKVPNGRMITMTIDVPNPWSDLQTLKYKEMYF